MKEKYILVVDQGTTSSRAILFNHNEEIVYKSQQEVNCFFPHDGWVEQNALDIYLSVLFVINDLLLKTNLTFNDIDSLGITNQRETTIIWDKKTGVPVYNAIVWQSRQSASICDSWSKYKDLVHKKTGLIINPYFSGTKIRWILKNVEEAKEKLEAKKLLAGTIDCWLVWKLTNGAVHATDVTNASRTLLFNIHTLEWDQELLDILEIPKEILPEVKSSSDYFGDVDPKLMSHRATHKVPITGVAGDQQSALFGQLCVDVGMVKNTYGTGCFTLINTGNKVIESKNKLLTTVAWKIKNEKPVYALEGSVFIAGSAIKWLRDSIKIIYNAQECDFYCNLAAKNDQDVCIVPSFTGLGAPYWDSYSRGAIFGLERGTQREHIVKATVESIAFQSNDLIKSMEKDLGKQIPVLKVDGGASNSDYLMQFQSSISDIKVERPKNIETTAMGACYFAGLYVGFWKSLDEIKKIAKIDKTFTPNLDKKIVERKTKIWNEAIKRTMNWTKAIE